MAPSRIEQRGEDPAALVRRYDLTSRFAALRPTAPEGDLPEEEIPAARDAGS